MYNFFDICHFVDNDYSINDRCSEPEQQLNIPVDTLKRKIKTKEQRQVELEEQIRRKQEELEKITGVDKKTGKKIGRLIRSSSDEEESEEEEEEEESDEDIISRPSRKVKTVAKRAIQVEKNELLQKSITNVSLDMPIRKGKSGGLTPSIALQNKNLRPHQIAVTTEKVSLELVL